MPLTSDRTTIEKLNPKHFDSLIEMYLEPDSNKFVTPLKDRDKDFFLKFLKKKMNANEKEVGFWTVKEKYSDQIIGTVNLNLFERLNLVHVGCHLKRDYWNLGFGKELFSRMIHYGIEERELSEIHGIIEMENQVSKRLLLGLGFTLVRQDILDDTPIEIYKYTSSI
jgi:[ribosomal protein S5]-alanine N-acetyltransferase